MSTGFELPLDGGEGADTCLNGEDLTACETTSAFTALPWRSASVPVVQSQFGRSQRLLEGDR